MTTATDTQLDEQTRDELQPPCEFRIVHHLNGMRVGYTPCPNAAGYAVRSVCPGCGPKLDLICEPHTAYARVLCVHCSDCPDHPRLMLVSMERI